MLDVRCAIRPHHEFNHQPGNTDDTRTPIPTQTYTAPSPWSELAHPNSFLLLLTYTKFRSDTAAYDPAFSDCSLAATFGLYIVFTAPF
jgi:hypothetical protein